MNDTLTMSLTSIYTNIIENYNPPTDWISYYSNGLILSYKNFYAITREAILPNGDFQVNTPVQAKNTIPL